MQGLQRYAYLSIAAAVLTIALKAAAYLVTNSVGLLSDACESVVNLVAAIVALYSLELAARPADEDHSYGHSKAEYFSSVTEGVLILVAAVLIAYSSVERILNPKELQEVDVGLVISCIASLINFLVALKLRFAGKKYNSIALEADSKHLMTDVWTSVGVVVGVGAASLTGWNILYPIVALLVVINITYAAIDLIGRSANGLMDGALPKAELEALQQVLEKYRTEEVDFHALRTRQAGVRRFISFHVLLPGEWSLAKSHQLVEKIEQDIRSILENTHIVSHLEPREDESAYSDQELDRD